MHGKERIFNLHFLYRSKYVANFREKQHQYHWCQSSNFSLNNYDLLCVFSDANNSYDLCL